MRVVLDSSVLIAASISRAGTCAAVLEDVLAHHELVLSEYILGEVEQKLRGKFSFPEREIRPLVRILRDAGQLVEPAALPADACRDPDDVPVLGTAVSGYATAIITGDKDLLTLRHFREIQILDASRFWSLAHKSAGG